MEKGILIGKLCFLFFLSNILIFHYFNIKRKFLALVKLFFGGLILYLFLWVLLSGEKTQYFYSTLLIPLGLLGFLNGAFLHYFYFHFYLHFLQIMDRTPTTRIMTELDKSTHKKLTLEQLKQLFSIDKKISWEFEDMVSLGSLKKENGFYSLTDKGRLQLKVFCFVRDFIKLRRS